MADPFIGEIRMVAYAFAPRDWANCDGQLLAIKQNSALFALLGVQFGGDGNTTFALPDMRGRTPVYPGIDIPQQGSKGGSETVTLDLSTMAAHTHTFNGNTQGGGKPAPTDKVYTTAVWKVSQNPAAIYHTPVNLSPLNTGTCSTTGGPQGGGAQAHENRQPSQVVRFTIALQGLFPTRS